MKDRPVLLIRADASKEIGHGHVMRCLALAQEWQSRDGDVAIVSAQLRTKLVDRLRMSHIDIYELTDSDQGGKDALRTVSLATFLDADWLVLDGYQFNGFYQSIVGEHTRCKIMAIDDGMNPPGSIDIALNQNSWAVDPDVYGFGPTRMLNGSKYALLRKEFLYARGAVKDSIDATRVFIATGGTDNAGMRDRVAAIVRGSGFNAITDISAMAACDMAISAGGGTCWELAYLGIPSILFSTAENQRKTVEDLSNRGIAISLGSAEHMADWQIEDAVKSLAKHQDRRREMSSRGMKLVDGLGAKRVAEEMIG